MLYIRPTPYGRGGWDESYYTGVAFGLRPHLTPAYYKDAPTYGGAYGLMFSYRRYR